VCACPLLDSRTVLGAVADEHVEALATRDGDDGLRAAVRDEPKRLVCAARAGPLLQACAVARARPRDVRALSALNADQGERAAAGVTQAPRLIAATGAAPLLQKGTVSDAHATDVEALAARRHDFDGSGFSQAGDDRLARCFARRLRARTSERRNHRERGRVKQSSFERGGGRRHTDAQATRMPLRNNSVRRAVRQRNGPSGSTLSREDRP
jgi:hypothetical protein